MNISLNTIFTYLIISLLINIIILLSSLFLCFKLPNKEKVSVYECGFNSFHSIGEPFSIRFFLVAILFLIFDLEILYLLPWSMNTNLLEYFSQCVIFLFFVILILGLIYEWMKGGLEWN